MPRSIRLYDRAKQQRRLLTVESFLNPVFSGDNPSASPWVTQNATWTGGYSDPLGGRMAYKLAETATTGGHGIYDLRTRGSGAPFTMVVCLKAAERGFASTYHDTGPLKDHAVNLSTGANAPALGSGDAFFTSVLLGAGWVLLVQEFTGTGGSEYCGFYACVDINGNLSYAGTAGSGIYYFRPRIYPSTFTQVQIDQLAGIYAWGAAGRNNDLPLSHPYKNRPPLI